MAEFLPGDEDICFTCHLMQECTDAGKLPPCLGVIEPVQQPITNVKSSADATVPQMPPTCSECPCENNTACFEERRSVGCSARLWRHFF